MIKKVLAICIIIVLIGGFLMQWKHYAELEVYKSPNREWMDITPILEKDVWDETDYRTIFYQTGLGRRAIDTLSPEEKEGKILYAQTSFFNSPTIECTKNSIISWQEQNINGFVPDIIGIENGDILVSFCTHTYGWRNGHVGIVVDAKEGKTLEAIVMGQDSCIQNVDKWRRYPAFIVLRLKNVSKEKREEIAEYALENMKGIPYGFVTDVAEHIIKGEFEIGDTDCSHLIWRSYKNFGYDLDSDGGIIVTPRDIAESPLLEVVQVYGIDMDTIREKEKVLDEVGDSGIIP